jgi:succinyl-CoA synthetase alpha subunit
LVDKDTKVVVQGITGTVGSFQSKIMAEYGTDIVAGVTPGKGGQSIYGVPVYDLVEEAVGEHGGDASILFVPGPYAADAALEAIEAGLGLVVITAEGVPLLDLMKVLNRAEEKGVGVIGPDTAGLISPGVCKVGVHPHRLFKRGSIGVVSKSGALSYEVSKTLTEGGWGQSTVIGIGGGPMWGFTQVDALEKFESDEGTDAIVLLGEIGGSMEVDAANYIKENVSKPVVSLIVGRHAPEGERMGHAGAIIEGGVGSAGEKIKALRGAGVSVVMEPREIPVALEELL